MKQIRKRLTYANVMSSIAVFLVLGGATAFAASKIGAHQLKANSVLTGKIKKEAITSSKLKKNSVIGSKVKDGSLTGTDINASTLGTVPSATKSAKTEQIANIFFTANSGSAKQTVLNLGGLTLTAACEGGGGDVQVDATTAVAHSLIYFFTPQDGDEEVNQNFSPGETFDADDGHDQGSTVDFYHLRYSRPDGVNVFVELYDVDPDTGPTFPGTPQQAECFLGGVATTS